MLAFQGLPLTLHQVSQVTLLLSTAFLQARPGERHAGGAVDPSAACGLQGGDTESRRIWEDLRPQGNEGWGTGEGGADDVGEPLSL